MSISALLIPSRTVIENVLHPEWGTFSVTDRTPAWFNIRGQSGERLLFPEEADREWRIVTDTTAFTTHDIFPEAILNGSSQQHLQDASQSVVDALDRALEQMGDVVHPRDFIGRDKLYESAKTQHDEQAKALRTLRDHWQRRVEHHYQQIQSRRTANA